MSPLLGSGALCHGASHLCNENLIAPEIDLRQPAVLHRGSTAQTSSLRIVEPQQPCPGARHFNTD
jgi:hypothetical protein